MNNRPGAQQLIQDRRSERERVHAAVAERGESERVRRTMRRLAILGVMSAVLGVACGGAPTSSPPGTARSASSSSGSAATGPLESTRPTTTTSSDGVRADAFVIFDAVRKTDEAFATIGLAPFKFDSGQRGGVIVGGRMQRTALGEQPLRENSLLAKAHEGLGELWGARNRTIRLEFDGGRVVDARPDAAKSAAEKSYIDFLDTSSSRVQPLYEKYYAKTNMSAATTEIVQVFAATARLRLDARDVFLVGAEHGLRLPEDWNDRAKLSWVGAREAAFVKAARGRVEESLPDALKEAAAAGPELDEAIKLDDEYERLFKAAATELRKRIDAGEPIPQDLADLASSIAQANEMVRRLRADPKAPPEKRKTLANIDEKLPTMRRAFCGAQRSYVDQHGLDSFQKASTLLCKTTPPEMFYRNQSVEMEAACLEAYRTHCP